MQLQIHSSWGQKLFNVAFFACIFWSLLAYLLYRCGRAVWSRAVASSR